MNDSQGKQQAAVGADHAHVLRSRQSQDTLPVTAEFRFYAELNRFLAPSCRQRSVLRQCAHDASVKHMIEAMGVPHTEVELILVDGASVDFSHRLRDGEHVSVYPAFTGIDLPPSRILRPPLRLPVRFVADAHLGRLAKYLRMLGFDVLYRNDFHDADLVRLAVDEERVVLTRDRDLLIRREIRHGCYLHALESERQLLDVVHRFRLSDAIRPFSRCLDCNGLLRAIAKEESVHRVPEQSWHAHERFWECEDCAHVYWEGSHVARMRAKLAALLDVSDQRRA
jgi:uncharacterized protein with PIN domain